MHTRTVIVVGSWFGIVIAVTVLLLLAGHQFWAPVPPGESLRDNMAVGGLLVLILVAVVLLAWADVRRGQRVIHHEHQQILSQLGALQAAVAEVRRAPVRAHAYIGRAVVSSTEEVATTELVRPASRRRRRREPEQPAGLTPEMVEIARRVDRRLRGT